MIIDIQPQILAQTPIITAVPPFSNFIINLNGFIFTSFLLILQICNTHFFNTSSVFVPLFLESYSVTIGRKLVAWGQKKNMVLKAKHIQGCVPAHLHQFSHNGSQRFKMIKKKKAP